MKYPAVIAIVLLYSLSCASAADSQSGGRVQNGRLSGARLLATARLSGNDAPDGMRFLFMVTRTPDATGQFTLKETRDILIEGDSYQEKTQSELGKRFEPGTVFDTAENFFSRQPRMRNLAPDDIKGAYILSLTSAARSFRRAQRRKSQSTSASTSRLSRLRFARRCRQFRAARQKSNRI